jgi:hypothetical protein
MDLAETMSLSFMVISDRRVIFIAVAVILIWAALRYVGTVYHDRSPRRSRPAAGGKRKVASPKRGREREAPAEGTGDDTIG